MIVRFFYCFCSLQCYSLLWILLLRCSIAIFLHALKAFSIPFNEVYMFQPVCMCIAHIFAQSICFYYFYRLCLSCAWKYFMHTHPVHRNTIIIAYGILENDANGMMHILWKQRTESYRVYTWKLATAFFIEYAIISS